MKLQNHCQESCFPANALRMIHIQKLAQQLNYTRPTISHAAVPLHTTKLLTRQTPPLRLESHTPPPLKNASLMLLEQPQVFLLLILL